MGKEELETVSQTSILRTFTMKGTEIRGRGRREEVGPRKSLFMFLIGKGGVSLDTGENDA